MSLSASCDSARQKRSLSSLLDSHSLKRPKQGDGQRLQEAAIQLLEQQQDLCSLFKEIGTRYYPSNPINSTREEQRKEVSEGIPSDVEGSLLVFGLRRQARQLAVPLATLSVKLVLERLREITGSEDNDREMLTAPQSVKLCALLESAKELLTHGCLCPKLLWQEYRKYHKLPKLDVVYQLHLNGVLTLKDILKSDEGVRLWLVPQLKALCSWTPPQEDKETMQAQQKVMSGIVGLLVSFGFQSSHEPAAMEKRDFLLCTSALDAMLFWFLDTVDTTSTQKLCETATDRWCQLFADVSTYSDVNQRFFMHSLTQTLTYKPRLTVSDAISLQNKWTFEKASRLLTSLFRKLSVIFSVNQLLRHLQQVLETHEVNWKHVLCFLSTLLVYNPSAQPSLRELLSRLLTSAFEGYDLESMITAFLLARQGALQGPAIFPSYCDWFKECFGGASGFHATSKKSLVFLLKFLSDLVPFEPPQYLKVHILHPPYVPVKYRSLLMEYVSLAKTRLADLKESVEEMGLYGDVSGAEAAPVQCQAVQDVDKAVSLFENTGRLSATVMEASIFRRSYFLTRFLPTLLKPKVLPVKADAQMSFIEALKKANKIPAAQYSAYVDSCQRLRQQEGNAVHVDNHDHPLQLLEVQLQELVEHVVDGSEGDMSAQLSKVSHTLGFIFPGLPTDALEKEVIQLQTDTPQFSDLHMKVVNVILRRFCQCILDSSQVLSPNKQILWASRFVSVFTCNIQLLSCLLHRLWDLLHNQGSLLSGPHLLGLAAFAVHLHASTLQSPLVHLASLCPAKPVPISEALSSALVCSTQTNMLFCVRFCMAAVSYGICRGDSLTQPQKDLIPSSFYKKLQYLIPRLLPEARRTAGSKEAGIQETDSFGLWSNAKDSSSHWKKTAWCLWRHPAFNQLLQAPQYQLFFTEWLANESQVERSKDALTDSERLEYHQWACLHLYLTAPDNEGGCGGSMKSLFFHLFHAIMDQQSSEKSKKDHTISQRGTCLPDIICILQEVVYEMDLTPPAVSHPGRADVCDFLFELVSERFSGSLTEASAQLSCEHTLNTWNRVLLALPSVSFIKVKAEEGRRHLDCDKLIQHVNQHQRSVCLPGGLLSFHLTSHFLKGILYASARCSHVGEEFCKILSLISQRCPLLLVSTVYWWDRMSAAVLSLWCRLSDGATPPGQLQIIASSQHWACSLMGGQLLQVPSAPALLLASSIYEGLQGQQDVHAALSLLEPDKDVKHREVLVFLLFLCVNNYLSALLYPQEKCHQKAIKLCTEVLRVAVDSTNWLLIFKSNAAEKGVYQSVNMVTSDRCDQLMPWAFYSVLLEQSAELHHKVVRRPDFLSAAVCCYIGLQQIFLDGFAISDPPESQILSRSKRFLLSAIPHTPASSSCRLLTQLQTQCVSVDPEVAAALFAHLNAHTLITEMEFL
ncbi:Fanconi anemia group A protein isoform X1 [Entelurus aequoreus]|uniref:Fanconi anemia group A protein isoform X1 n=1 Tax=Entelurus aequoreus TaxID=161455 RepID=UPI002B1DABAB|nr:Fanconi anemia group A protein isoform X1 [Entelurus aequoreus]XP_061878379.1 Fanconi anemia group A protein isoform X1 [Entelurus aequoreus]